MPEMSPGTALRQLQQTQAGLKKIRQAMSLARGDRLALQRLLKVGWEGLANSQSVLAAIPLSAATEPVMTKQLAVQRYATALLVRLRRIVRNEDAGVEDEDDEVAAQDGS